MKKSDILSNNFLDRLAVVYGENGAKSQQDRYYALAEAFEEAFGASDELRFFSAPGRTFAVLPCRRFHPMAPAL